MRRPSMPIFWGDYLADTQHLETVQHGAYLLLIAHYWEHEGLPDDDKQLAKIAGLPLASWRQMQAKIQPFFFDGWKHRRVEAELAKYDHRIARLKVAGSNGGTKAKIARDNARKNGSHASSHASSQAIAHPASSHAVATLKKEINSSFLSGTARASENPANSNTEKTERHESVQNPPVPKASFSTATEAAATTKSGSAMSDEMARLVAAKGWS